MNVLYIPQVSSLSSEGDVLLSKDSNIAFLNNLLDSDFGANNNIDILFEFKITKRELEGIFPIKDNIRILKSSKHYFTNAMEERMHFDVDFYEKILGGNYDIVFVNEPTKVINIKTILNMLGKTKTKIVCYNHWLAFKNMHTIKYRQIEGMNNADLNLLNSDYAINEIRKFCSTHNIFIPTMQKLEPSFNGKYFKKLKSSLQNGINGIIYNHRLSSDKYYSGALNNLISIMDEVEKCVGIENMPLVYFTNPSGKAFNIEAIKPYFKFVNLSTSDEYYKFLQSRRINLHLNTFFDSEGMWSMSTTEAGATGNICLLPNKYGYSEIFEDRYYGYCDNCKQMADKLCELIKGNIVLGEDETTNNCLLTHLNEAIGMKLNFILSVLAMKEGE